MQNVIPFIEYYLRPVPGFTLVQPALEALAIRHWKHTGAPPAPRSVKATIIRRFGAWPRRTFVETGTFYGDMLASVRADFDVLHSIELSRRLARRARRRFATDRGIHIHEGDSGDLLGAVLRELRQPAVLWLDGHYSGPLTARGATDTPLLREIDAALRFGTSDDVILVDDARLLGVHPAYPTVDQLQQRIKAVRLDWRVSVESDIVIAGGVPA
jgi:hypothetical protein